MGGGNWSAATYDSTTGATLRSGGSGFAYSDTTKQRSYDEWKAHETLDPSGVDVREARDSDEHPLSVPIIVIFDVTGSMGEIPVRLQANLPKLLDAIRFGGAVEHPQIMFGAVGDAYSDRVPFQIGQFESDNRLDENLANIFIEGNGGGSGEESYDLALWFVANKIVTDQWEKRSQKGYFFLFGDEKFYPQVSAAQLSKVFGEEASEGVSTEAVLEQVLERWDFHYMIPMHHDGYVGNREQWAKAIGDERVHAFDVEGIADELAGMIAGAEDAREATA